MFQTIILTDEPTLMTIKKSRPNFGPFGSNKGPQILFVRFTSTSS